MWEFDVALSEIIQQTSDVKTFRFDVSDKTGVTYKVGQLGITDIQVKRDYFPGYD